MKSIASRTRIAAAALLAPLAVLAAGAAHADYAVVYGTQPAYPAWNQAQSGYGNPVRYDHRAPRISDVTPSQGERLSERGRTHISARLQDRGAGVDRHGITLRVDGRDVTGASRFDGDEIRYRENLAPGRHVAELVVRDRAGNTTRRDWSFFVLNDRGRDARYGWYNGAYDR